METERIIGIIVIVFAKIAVCGAIVFATIEVWWLVYKSVKAIPALLKRVAFVMKQDELEEDNMLLEKAIWSQGHINEDELPSPMPPHVFDMLFKVSKVDIVRIYPKLLVEALMKGGAE